MAAAWTQVAEQGAAEGIGFDFNSGDGGNNVGGGYGASVSFPGSDPWAAGVDGTTLEIGNAGAVTRKLGGGDTGDQENMAGTGCLQRLPGTFGEGSTGGRSDLFADSLTRCCIACAAPPASATSSPPAAPPWSWPQLLEHRKTDINDIITKSVVRSVRTKGEESCVPPPEGHQMTRADRKFSATFFARWLS